MTPDSEPSEPIELSVVLPCYNEAENLDYLFERLISVLEPLDITYELVCVNDGSRDQTLPLLVEFHKRYPVIKVVDLSRNFGKEIALTAGLDHARGRAVIPIDADLQDPPELIPEMLAKWREGADVVYAVRRTRQGESWIKQFTAESFYRVIDRLSQVHIPRNTGDFRLMDRRAVQAVRQVRERTRFMKGIFAWVGFRQVPIYYDRAPRYQGISKWNYWKLWNLAVEGITSFSSLPLRIWSYVGLALSGLSLLYACLLIVRTLVSGIDVPGYASLAVIALFLGGVQLISLGVIGEYLGRIFEEIKGRPLYLVQGRYGFSEALQSRDHSSPNALPTSTRFEPEDP